jgi:hypothetical protein
MSEIANKKKQEEEDMARGCGCFIILGIALGIFLWMLNNSVDAVKEVSIRDLVYANTAVIFHSPLHQARQDQILRMLELEGGVDIDDVFYKIVSNSKRVKNIRFKEGSSISGTRTVVLTMDVAKTVSKNPKTVNIKIQYYVQERNIWKLQFAKVYGVAKVILWDEEGRCTLSNHLESVITMVDIVQRIKNQKDIHARYYRLETN